MQTNPQSSVPINRRQFITTAAMVAAAVCASQPLLSLAQAVAPKRRGLDLNGGWQVAKSGTEDWIPATVPGCIHTDLLAAKKIADPFYRDNEKDLQWVGETNWVYRRSFEVPTEMLGHDRVVLSCEGLDTIATIKINGREVGSAKNMFRTWEFDVKSALQAGANTIEVVLEAPLPFVKQMEAESSLHKGVHGRAWLRKESCNFGWDWAPELATSGIWRNISLQPYDAARLENILISQDHTAKGQFSSTQGVHPSSKASYWESYCIAKCTCGSVGPCGSMGHMKGKSI